MNEHPKGYKSEIRGLARTTPLSGAKDRRATQDIGPEGGSLDLDAAGIHIEIPAGAVKERTMFTLMAHSAIHGFTVDMRPYASLAERAKVQIRLDQDTTGDVVLGCTNMVEETAIVHELYRMRRDGNHVHGSIPHFSGYMVGCGDKMGQPCNPGEENCVWVNDS